MVRKLFLTSYFKEVATFLPEFAGELHEKKDSVYTNSK